MHYISFKLCPPRQNPVYTTFAALKGYFKLMKVKEFYLRIIQMKWDSLAEMQNRDYIWSPKLQHQGLFCKHSIILNP